MGVHHFFTTPEGVRGGTVVLSGDEGHHAARVLRLRPGERITVADGSGRVFEAVVKTLSGEVEADIVDVHDVSVPRPMITIHQALMKGDRMDGMIEKSVELGVSRISPFVAERSIVRWDDSRKQKALERWMTITLSAAKQSRSPWLAAVDPVGASVPDVAAIVLHEDATARLRDVLPPDAPDDISFVVGPEGGLSEAEVGRLVLSGSTVVSLGERILRTETAGPAAAAIVAFVYGNLG